MKEYNIERNSQNLIKIILIKILKMYNSDPKIKILIFLTHNTKPVSIRKIARNLGYNHKSIANHLKDLENAGLVEIYYNQNNLKLYRLSNIGIVLKDLLNNDIKTS
jgi:DNA-binding transcriptional ArsR family regulator